MKRTILLAAGIVLAGLLASPGLGAQAQAGASSHESHHPQASQPAAPAAQQQMPAMGQMMTMHQSMMAEWQKQNAELDDLVKKMDEAQGQARIDAIANLLRTLVQQRSAMNADMMQMQGMMMNRMSGMSGMMGGMPGR